MQPDEYRSPRWWRNRGHEEWRQTHLRNDTVEPASGVAEPVLARRELAEVGRRLGDLGVVQLEDDAAGLLSADFDVELHSSSAVERADRRNRAYVDVGFSASTRLGQNTVRDAKDGPHSDMVE